MSWTNDGDVTVSLGHILLLSRMWYDVSGTDIFACFCVGFILVCVVCLFGLTPMKDENDNCWRIV